MNLKEKLCILNKIPSPSSRIILVLESFFASWAIMRISNLHSMNIIGFLFFLLCFMFFSAVKKETPKRTLAAVFALLFTIFYISDIYHELVLDLSNGLFQIVIIGVTFLGLYFLFYNTLLFLMYKMDGFSLPDSINKKEENKSNVKMKLISRLPVICFIFCVLCRIPYLLYSYPGIMTPDSINQFEQVIGMKPFSNHHPWLHTLTIGLFYNIGTLFTSSINDAFVFFTIFQICFMAFAAAFLIWVLTKYTKCLPLLLGIIGFYGLMPYHNVMAICIWKDVMFAGALLLFSTSLFHLFKEGVGKHTGFSTAVYFLSGFLMCLYRSNGWYAFILTFPFLLISFRKSWKVMYPLHFLLLCLVLFVKGPVMEHYEVKQPDFIESFSIPLQQMGRVIAKGKELTPEQNELVNKVVDSSHIPDLYTEYISDNIKELVKAGNPEYLISHKTDYLKLWIQLGLKYPDIYLDAYIEQTRGFYSPSAVYSVAEVDDIIPNETGLYREYLISGKVLLKVREILIKLQNIIPLYGAFWSMGSLFWGILICLCLTLSRKKVPFLTGSENMLNTITVWIPNIAVICTLLIATPVAIEFRYAYNLAYCIPLYLGIMLTEKIDTKM